MRWPPIAVEEFPGASRWTPWLAAAVLIGVVFWLASHVVLLLFAGVSVRCFSARPQRLDEP